MSPTAAVSGASSSSCGAALGLAVLTKGPLPCVIWLLTLVATAIVSPAARRWRSMLPVAGPLFFLAVVAPWGIAALLAGREVHDTWMNQTVGRFTGDLGGLMSHSYFLSRVVLVLLPWLLAAAAGIWLAARRRILDRLTLAFLLSWGFGTLLVLALCRYKRTDYALDLAPPFAVFAGIALDSALFRLRRPFPWSARLVLLAHVVLVVAALAFAYSSATAYPEFRRPILAAAAVFALAAVLSTVFFAFNRRPAALVVFAAFFAVSNLIAIGAVVRPLLRLRDSGIPLSALVRDTPEGDFAFYKLPDPRVIYSTRRTFPVLRTPAALAVWASSHPSGLVIVEDVKLSEVLSVGEWSAVFPPPSASRHLESQMLALRVAQVAD